MALRGLVRRNAGWIAEFGPHSWPCAEKRSDHLLGVAKDPRDGALTALLGVLQRGNSLPVSDLGVGAGVEEDGHNLLITPRSVAQNHCLE